MSLVSVLQVIVALGLLNVWLVRSSTATAYRGGAARTLREEFAAYGLPTWFFFLCGALKVLSAVCLLVGLWVPTLVLPAASLVVVLMLGALAMHVKVQDPSVKSLPALLMLAMSAVLCGLSLSS
jgi:hypothetical protein